MKKIKSANLKNTERPKKQPYGIPTTFNGLKLKSGLEKTCYMLLISNNINDFVYEGHKFELQPKFEFQSNSFQSYKRLMTLKEAKDLGLKPRFKNQNKKQHVYQFGKVREKIRPIIIQPDFSRLDFTTKTGWIIETKGTYTDAYLLKLRLFKYYLQKNGWNIDYFAPNNKTTIIKSIEEIKKKYYA